MSPARGGSGGRRPLSAGTAMVGYTVMSPASAAALAGNYSSVVQVSRHVKVVVLPLAKSPSRSNVVYTLPFYYHTLSLA